MRSLQLIVYFVVVVVVVVVVVTVVVVLVPSKYGCGISPIRAHMHSLQRIA